jgi:hypothetical protein
MKLAAAHFRVLLVLVNLLLASAVFGSACAFFCASPGPSSAVKRIDPSVFALETPSRFTSTGDRWDLVAGNLEPADSHPVEVAIPPPSPSSPVSEDFGGDTGPLAGQWEYVFYFLRADPRQSLVVLRRKNELAMEQAVERPKGQRRPRPNVRPSNPDRTLLCVSDGPEVAERLGLGQGIEIDSADGEKIVYRSSGDPERKDYRLLFKSSPGYRHTGLLEPRKRLTP